MALIDKFLGLRNTAQPEQLQPGSLVQADNVQITKEGMIERRPLETKIVNATAITSSYGTLDEKAIFLVDSGSLYVMEGGGIRLLANGFNTDPVYWCEESSELVFFVGGGLAGYIEGKGKVTLLNTIDSPVIACAYHSGMLVLALHDNAEQTFILFSKPYEYDQYYEDESGFFIPGRVTGMQHLRGSLLITTVNNVFVYTSEDALVKLADYGTPLGKTMMLSDNKAYIWTNKGLCKYPEFENLTGKTVSVPPGYACCNNLLEYDGSSYALVLTDGGGFADNPIQ